MSGGHVDIFPYFYPCRPTAESTGASWSQSFETAAKGIRIQALSVKDFYHLGRVHTTLFRTGRDRSRPVRAQLPVSTRGQLERSFRILETTSRHGTSGRDRSRSVAPCQIYRVDARVGATDLSANQPLLAHAFLIYFFPF